MTRSRLYSLSSLSWTISMCSSPKKPHLGTHSTDREKKQKDNIYGNFFVSSFVFNTHSKHYYKYFRRVHLPAPFRACLHPHEADDCSSCPSRPKGMFVTLCSTPLRSNAPVTYRTMNDVIRHARVAANKTGRGGNSPTKRNHLFFDYSCAWRDKTFNARFPVSRYLTPITHQHNNNHHTAAPEAPNKTAK